MVSSAVAQNRAERLAETMRAALVAPKRRVKTRLSLNQKRKQVEAAKKRGEVKALRDRKSLEYKAEVATTRIR
ncbi:MAG: hypothetical protein Gyms2KO_38570 [Gymnodinialimonas sp.]